MTVERRSKALIMRTLLNLLRCMVYGLTYAIVYRLFSSAYPGSEGTIVAAMLGVSAARLDAEGMAYQRGKHGGDHLKH